MKDYRWIFIFFFILIWLYIGVKSKNEAKLADKKINATIYSEHYLSSLSPDTVTTNSDTANYSGITHSDTSSITFEPSLDTLSTPNTFPDSNVVEKKPEIVSSFGSVYGSGLVDSPLPSSINSNTLSGTNTIPLPSPLLSKEEINDLIRNKEVFHNDVYIGNTTNTITNTNTSINYNTNPNVETVKGHLRSNGTFVAPYQRTIRNSTPNDNFSFKNNYNPNTGKVGTKKF